MPVPSAITDLSTTAGSNSPSGSESPITTDNYLRSHASFIAQLYDGTSGQKYVPAGTGAVTTTVQAKLRESVSALDYPASGSDDSARIQAAYNYLISTGVGGTINLPTKVGGWQINTPLNFTSSQIPITLRGTASNNIPDARPNDSTLGSVLWGNTGTVVIDISARANFGLENIVIDTNNATKCTTPSRVGILGGRVTAYSPNQNHHFENIAVFMKSTGNAALPSIGHYAYGTELGTYINCWFFADLPAAYLLAPFYSVTSPFVTLAATGTSATCNSFNGCKYVTVSGLNPSVHLDGTYDNSFTSSYFLNETTGVQTNAAVLMSGYNYALNIDTFQSEGHDTFFEVTGSLLDSTIDGFHICHAGASGAPVGKFTGAFIVTGLNSNINVGGPSGPYDAYTGNLAASSFFKNNNFLLGQYGNVNITAGAGGTFNDLEFSNWYLTPTIKLNNGTGTCVYTVNGEQFLTGVLNTNSLQVVQSAKTNNTAFAAFSITVPNANLYGTYLFDYAINSSSNQLVKSGQVKLSVGRVTGSATVLAVSESIPQQSVQAAGAETIAVTFAWSGVFDPVTGPQYAFLNVTLNSSTGGTGYIRGTIKALSGTFANTGLVDGQKILLGTV